MRHHTFQKRRLISKLILVVLVVIVARRGAYNAADAAGRAWRRRMEARAAAVAVRVLRLRVHWRILSLGRREPRTHDVRIHIHVHFGTANMN